MTYQQITETIIEIIKSYKGDFDLTAEVYNYLDTQDSETVSTASVMANDFQVKKYLENYLVDTSE